VLRRIFGPKREEVAGGWRRQHNEELHNLYVSPDIRVTMSRRMTRTEHVAVIVEVRNAYKIVIGNSKLLLKNLPRSESKFSLCFL